MFKKLSLTLVLTSLFLQANAGTITVKQSDNSRVYNNVRELIAPKYALDADLSGAGKARLSVAPVVQGGVLLADATEVPEYTDNMGTLFFNGQLLYARTPNGGTTYNLNDNGISSVVDFTADNGIELSGFPITGNGDATISVNKTVFAIPGGNTNTAALTLGTNDNYGVNLETNGSTIVTIDNNGNVGIQDSSPDYVFDVAGTFNAEGAATLASTLAVTGNSVLASADVGGGYGSTGATIAATGAITTNSTLVVDGASTLSGAVGVGGGFGSTGVTISAAGVIDADGAITSEGAINGQSLVSDSTLAVTTSATVGTTLGVTGVATLSDNADIAGNATITGTLGVTGATTLVSTIINGAVSLNGTELAVNGTISLANIVTVVNGADTAVTATLPAVSGNANKIAIIALYNNGNTLTIEGNASETIDNELNITRTANGATMLFCDGDEWFKLMD